VGRSIGRCAESGCCRCQFCRGRLVVADAKTRHHRAGLSGDRRTLGGRPIHIVEEITKGAHPMEKSQGVTRIMPSEEERSARAFSSATLAKAAYCMRSDGALVLEDIVTPTLIREARGIFIKRYDRYLDGGEHDDALEVGDKRPMITLDLEP